MDVVAHFWRWMTPPPQRPLLDAVHAWTRASDEVLVIEHRFSRCELHHGPDGVLVRLPAATLFMHPEAAPSLLPPEGYRFVPELGGYECSLSRSPLRGSAFARTLARAVQNLVNETFQRRKGIAPVLTREPRGLPAPTELEASGSFTAAMRSLAKTRNQEDRRAVYQAFVQGNFLVPLRFDERDARRLAILPAEESEASPAVGATFTSWSDAHRWRRSAGEDLKPWAIFSGLQLLTLHARHPMGSLLINPGGDVGGELLGHELNTLVQALHLDDNDHDA